MADLRASIEGPASGDSGPAPLSMSCCMNCINWRIWSGDIWDIISWACSIMPPPMMPSEGLSAPFSPIIPSCIGIRFSLPANSEVFRQFLHATRWVHVAEGLPKTRVGFAPQLLFPRLHRRRGQHGSPEGAHAQHEGGDFGCGSKPLSGALHKVIVLRPVDLPHRCADNRDHRPRHAADFHVARPLGPVHLLIADSAVRLRAPHGPQEGFPEIVPLPILATGIIVVVVVVDGPLVVVVVVVHRPLPESK